MEKHFVKFMSPGTFLAEESLVEIDSWDVDKAVELSRGIEERYGAKPYGFKFITKGRDEGDLDSKVVNTSPTHYLGGYIETLAQVEARDDPEEHILRSNMRGNGWDKIIVNNNSWKWTEPFADDAVLLDVTL